MFKLNFEDEDLRMELDKELKHKGAHDKGFLKETVLLERIYRFQGWDIVFNEWTLEQGTDRSRIYGVSFSFLFKGTEKIVKIDTSTRNTDRKRVNALGTREMNRTK